LQRAGKIKDFLVRQGKIEPERIFLVEAKSLSPFFFKAARWVKPSSLTRYPISSAMRFWVDINQE
jgi:hypothetical protein